MKTKPGKATNSKKTTNSHVSLTDYSLFDISSRARSDISVVVCEFVLVNKFIMKVTKERNPYLKRIFSQTPHKYS